jgi:hypothetical protein
MDSAKVMPSARHDFKRLLATESRGQQAGHKGNKDSERRDNDRLVTMQDVHVRYRYLDT